MDVDTRRRPVFPRYLSGLALVTWSGWSIIGCTRSRSRRCNLITSPIVSTRNISRQSSKCSKRICDSSSFGEPSARFGCANRAQMWICNSAAARLGNRDWRKSLVQKPREKSGSSSVGNAGRADSPEMESVVCVTAPSSRLISRRQSLVLLLLVARATIKVRHEKTACEPEKERQHCW
jgi:hypothetical protein